MSLFKDVTCWHPLPVKSCGIRGFLVSLTCFYDGDVATRTRKRAKLNKGTRSRIEFDWFIIGDVAEWLKAHAWKVCIR